jgi:hypothetical protein
LTHTDPEDNPEVRRPMVANTPACRGFLKLARQKAGQLLLVWLSDQVPPMKVVQFFTKPTTRGRIRVGPDGR